MHPDLPSEQAYFDRALALRDRQQAGSARPATLAANPRATLELRKRVSPLGLADPDEAIAFGRIDAADGRWYIGKGAIWDDDNRLVVVNWQAPIAAPFYTATPEDPEGLDARRLYRCTGNQIREIEDLMFQEAAEAVTEGRAPEPVPGDALLEALGSARSGELADIVATIQAAQYEVISRPLDELLVVQGGPGTGKTLVGLHRVSWLLFNERGRLDARDVLVVGPSRAFVRYIEAVLPALGDDAVVQLPLQALGPPVRVGRVDPPEVRRIKGDRRLLRLILRGVRNRQRVAATPLRFTVEGRAVELDGRRVATRARQLAGRPHNEGHRMLRAFLVAEVEAALAEGTAADPPRLPGDALGEIEDHLALVWPRLTPQSFLVELLSSRRQLLAAGAGTLSEAELDLLAIPADAQVGTWQWSVDDVPVLDAAAAVLDGVAATYDHIVVDEAQDLSPLQLESIRRRSRAGSMTVLGDLAQATSPWAPTSWEPVVQVLRHERVTAEVVELEHGYRLPVEVHEVAMRLLPEIAPAVSRPRALRSSGHGVDVVPGSAGDLPTRVVATVRSLAGDGIVGVIAPAALRAALAAALDEGGIAWSGELSPGGEPVVLLTPDEAKGLELDSVIVVEPAAIVAASDRGLHSLFLAMTRCTSRLALVHARPLPPILGLGGADVGGGHSSEAGTGPGGERRLDPSRNGRARSRLRWPDVLSPGSPRAAAGSAAAPPGAVVGGGGRPSPPTPVPAGDPVPGQDPVPGGDPVPRRGDPVGLTAGPLVPARAAEVALGRAGQLDQAIAAAVAGTVADRIVHAVRPALLPMVAAELARALGAVEEDETGEVDGVGAPPPSPPPRRPPTR
ncbi:MAG TPA: hypothetical protein VFW63_05880 [Acidimicrobiales bacterium]|nr:hypothetical protein [Acidimicrobiales bacterium]